VLGSGERQHGPGELVDGGGQPGHALLAGLAARLPRAAEPLLHGHHLPVPPLLRSVPALQRLRQDRRAPSDRAAQDVAVVVGVLRLGAVVVLLLLAVMSLFLIIALRSRR
jgi:hypothetical protein